MICRNVVSGHTIFIMTPGKIFGRTGYLTVNKNGAALNNRRWWYDIFEFMERNTIASEVQMVGDARQNLWSQGLFDSK